MRTRPNLWSHYFQNLAIVQESPPPSYAQIIEFDKTKEALKIKDVTGESEDRNRLIKASLPVYWYKYEIDWQGNHLGEKLNSKAENKPYLTIDFRKFDGAPVNIIIAKNYFSIVVKKTQ